MIEDDYELSQILTQYLNKFDIDVIDAEEPYIGLSLLTQHQIWPNILDFKRSLGIDGTRDLSPKDLGKKFPRITHLLYSFWPRRIGLFYQD